MNPGNVPMRTDKQIFEVFHVAPWMMADLLQMRSAINCRYVSMSVKSIEKEADGILTFALKNPRLSAGRPGFLRTR